MAKVLLEAKNLNVDLDGDKIIENLSFSVSKGDVLTILGPNGAGKSVLLKVLLNLLPHKGSVVWHDKPKIGYLPQGLNQLKVKDFPLTVLDFFKLKQPIPKRADIIEYLGLVGLERDILSKTAGNLSSGQFQRMLIAWVLISKPNVIFFDEPTTGVDIGGGETIYSLLNAIRKERELTIFLVTHDLNIVYKQSTSVLCLSRKGHHCFGEPEKALDPQTLEQIFGTEIKLYGHR